jgi:acyl-coenzyme A synthetase/AMP-(fatty) acid ligase
MLVRTIQEWAAVQPQALAIEQHGDEISYQRFLSLIAAFQAPLLAHGSETPATAVILTQDLADSWIMSLAVRALGWDAIVVQRAEALAALDLRNAGILLANDELRQSLAAAAAPLGENIPVVAIPRRTATDSKPDVPRQRDRFGSQILYTTGTTGRHKKVEMAGALEDARNQYRAASFGVTRDTVAYTNLSPFCGAGFKTPSSVWHSGGTMVFDETLDLLPHLERHGVNCVLVGPNQLRSLVAAGPLPETVRHSFEIVYTSGPLPLDLAQRAAEGLSRDIRVYWGATEIIGRPLRTSFRDLDDLLWLTPEPGRDIAILRDDGSPCDIDEEGTLAIGLAPVDASAYLDDPQATARFFRDGRFVPGDRAVRRSDGRIRLLGREADVIVIRGQKISVHPIEQAVQNYLKAEEVCIFAEMNAAGEEEALVAVRIGRDITRDEMRELVTRHLPFELVRFARLSEFPKSEGAFGKTLRAELRKMLLAARPGQR